MEYQTLEERRLEKARNEVRASVAARMKATAKRKARILREIRASIKAKVTGLAPVPMDEPAQPQRMSPDELASSIGVTPAQLRDGFKKLGIHPQPKNEDRETTIEVTEDEVQALTEHLERAIKMNNIKSRR